MKEYTIRLAKAVLEAQRLREESYVVDKNSDFGYYTKSHNDCAKKACGNVAISYTVVDLIAVMNSAAWNDVQCWAETILGKE